MSISDLSPYLGSDSPVVALLTSLPRDRWVYTLETASGNRRDLNLRELFRAVIQSRDPAFFTVGEQIVSRIRVSKSESKEFEHLQKKVSKAAKKLYKQEKKAKKQKSKSQSSSSSNNAASSSNNASSSSNNASSAPQKSGKDEKIEVVDFTAPQEVHPRGIMNLGSSCYLNSVLQMIRHSDTYVSIITNDQIKFFRDDSEKKKSNLRELQTHLRGCFQDLFEAKQLSKRKNPQAFEFTVLMRYDQ